MKCGRENGESAGNKEPGGVMGELPSSSNGRMVAFYIPM
jgi:hypothetical protein